MKRRGVSVIEILVVLIIVCVFATLVIPTLTGSEHSGEFVCLKTYQTYGDIPYYYVTLESDEGTMTCRCSIVDFGRFVDGRRYVVKYRGEVDSWLGPSVTSLDEID